MNGGGGGSWQWGVSDEQLAVAVGSGSWQLAVAEGSGSWQWQKAVADCESRTLNTESVAVGSGSRLATENSPLTPSSKPLC